MAPHVIPLLRNRHGDIQALLPWFATGALEPSEREAVRLHIMGCADCRNELAEARGMASAYVETQTETLALSVEDGWAELSRQMDRDGSLGATDRSRRSRPPARERLATRWGTGWLGLTAAAQFAVIVILCGVLWRQPSARYHTLSAKPVAVANLVVIFQPDTPERVLRQLLNANAARLVDGPSAADAYMVKVPSARRDQALQNLRHRPEVALAEPVDGG